MSNEIIPVSRSLYLCDFHVGYQDGKVDLYGIFNAIRADSFPLARPRLVVFVQLSGGIGDVPFYFDVRQDGTDVGICTTPIRSMRFSSRTAVIQLAMTIEGVHFPEPGMYVIDLFCHNKWVCDATVLVQ